MPEESIRHALTGFVYTRLEDGRVRVADPSTGREGLFGTTGAWESGELTYVDHHMLGHMCAARAKQRGMYGGQRKPKEGAQ